MTKKEIVKRISDELGLTQLITKKIVQMTFDAIVDALVEEERIELRNFGVFEVKERKPRKARNPRTGESVFVEGKQVVTFRPGKEMEIRVADLIDKRKSRLAGSDKNRTIQPATTTSSAATENIVMNELPYSNPRQFVGQTQTYDEQEEVLESVDHELESSVDRNISELTSVGQEK